MNAKDNALRIVHFDHPERVVSGAPKYTVQYQGCDHESFSGPGDDHPAGSRWTDIWGTGWHKELDGVMGFPRGNPLADVGALADYRWPDANDERICRRIYSMARDFPGDDLFLAGNHRDTLWEKAYMLVGMENMMMYFYTEPGFAGEVLHRIMDFQLGIAQHYLELGVEMALLGDDLGTQQGPLLNPQVVEQFLVPEYERLFSLYRRKGVLIRFHSCGRIDWMLETFMRLGVDILNPVQATANDLQRVRAITQGRMTLDGGVSSAAVMDGPAQCIDREVSERVRLLGQQGGYFCRPDQSLPFPQEHVAALERAIERYGCYPLQPSGEMA
jgi:uroporphyrinogen decarboxylase